MTREEAKNWLNKLYARADITDEYGDMEDMQPYEEAVIIAVKALEQEPKTEPDRCNQCKYYEGVHNVQGHAPCSFLKCGGVLWDWYCSNYEPTGAESEE